ncbi:MAG: hypothetical protein GY761_04080 [Hyphomicrobiales bacterium]|nr:hypothetical protein [Hyphomicrobiales bacterium]
MMMFDYSISKPVNDTALRVVSFGAGVQSTVMLLMACRREIGPMPDVAIFADTQWEPKQIYKHLEWVKAEVARLTNGQVPVLTVSAGDIRADHLAGLNTTKQHFTSMPLYTEGGKGMGRRQCTKEYKIDPITKEIRRLLGVEKGKRVPKNMIVEQWLGISSDELQRLKNSRIKWIVHRWPLIEALMSRADCRAWFERKYPGIELVKSACIGCPFKDYKMWQALKLILEEWNDACDFDEAIRLNGSKLSKMNSQQYVHRSGTPLRTAYLGDTSTSDFFQEECEGMCGL